MFVRQQWVSTSIHESCSELGEGNKGATMSERISSDTRYHSEFKAIQRGNGLQC